MQLFPLQLVPLASTLSAHLPIILLIEESDLPRNVGKKGKTNSYQESPWGASESLGGQKLQILGPIAAVGSRGVSWVRGNGWSLICGRATTSV